MFNSWLFLQMMLVQMGNRGHTWWGIRHSRKTHKLEGKGRWELWISGVWPIGNLLDKFGFEVGNPTLWNVKRILLKINQYYVENICKIILNIFLKYLSNWCILLHIININIKLGKRELIKKNLEKKKKSVAPTWLMSVEK